jgi:hypothetical protein
VAPIEGSVVKCLVAVTAHMRSLVAGWVFFAMDSRTLFDSVIRGRTLEAAAKSVDSAYCSRPLLDRDSSGLAVRRAWHSMNFMSRADSFKCWGFPQRDEELGSMRTVPLPIERIFSVCMA